MSISLLWLRQDLRLTDQPALAAALAAGPVLPVYVLDEDASAAWSMGAAQRWWLHHSLKALDLSLRKRGSALILRRGDMVRSLITLARETGADQIHAIRHYEPRHRLAEQTLAREVELHLHEGNHLTPLDMVRNGSGARYRVFTPWYRKLSEAVQPLPPLAAPDRIATPPLLPASDDLEAWQLLPRSPDWSTGFSDWCPGEKGAWRRWRDFERRLDRYARDRDYPAIAGTSRLSPHLHFGEISPRVLWSALAERTGSGPATFRRELAWRDHGANLLDQMADYPDRNGRAAFDKLQWRGDAAADGDFLAWTGGRTGYPIVDAGMRELWQSGWMHNRVRMVAASFLVKHLLIDWRRGERWFWDTLLDADLGSNAMNWQYVAGTGVDAPVFSRIMAPHLQSEKFDMAAYVRQWVPELASLRDAEIHALHFDGGGAPGYPERLVGHQEARARALGAWQGLGTD